MTKIKYSKYFFIYILVTMLLALIFKTVIVKAETTVKSKTSDKVYQLEINSKPDFKEIKEEILLRDIKYLVLPTKLQHDVELSEIIASDIDYASNAVQEVNLEIQRYAESMNKKTKIDTVEGKVKLQFIDTTAPEINLKQDSVTITEGSKLDVDDYLLDVTDNSFDEIIVDINNPIDINSPGTYEVVYSATDSSDNVAKEILTVTVNAKPVPKPQPVIRTSNNASVNSAAVSNDFYGALSLINSHRAANGLHPLQLAGGGEQAAAAERAAEASGYVSHVRPDGRHYKTAFTDRGLSHNNVIEILTFSGSSAADKVAWWMSSGAHRAALMSSSATHIALGSYGGMWAGLVYR